MCGVCFMYGGRGYASNDKECCISLFTIFQCSVNIVYVKIWCLKLTYFYKMQ